MSWLHGKTCAARMKKGGRSGEAVDESGVHLLATRMRQSVFF